MLRAKRKSEEKEVSKRNGKPDEECFQMMECLVEQMKAKQGETEQLKSENQMQWVGMKNNIRHCEEEVLLKDIVYA